jgi:glycosyltransferase involved in cell wall biosynthesis
VLVGTVGRLTPRKGHRVFIDAAELLGARREDVWFRIVGNPIETHRGYANELSESVRRSARGREGRLAMVEPANRSSAEFLAAFDVFVLPSLPQSEGIPTAMLEAMASGLPVVASDVGAVREVMNGEVGRIIPAGEVGAMADQIESLVHNSDRRHKLGLAARHLAAEEFTVQESARAHIAAIKRAAERRGRL